MRRTKRGVGLAHSNDAAVRGTAAAPTELKSVPRPEAPSGLAALELAGLDPAARTATLRVAGGTVVAKLDRALEEAVVATALARGERVIVQKEGDGWLVLGALRTSRTPGIDAGDDYVIRARRVHIEAGHEFAVTSGKASIVVRAYGYVETLAESITTRASSVHKVIGRMLRLN